MLKLKPSMLFGVLALPCSFLASAGGLTDSGKISLLSHEISGSYVQILDDQQAIIQSNPDSCADSNMYFLPIDHANYQVLSSSLLTAEMTQRELAFHVEGCENNMAKIAFVRFGNWQGVVLNSPTEPPATPVNGAGAARTQTFSTTPGVTTQATFNVPDGVHLVYVTMCGGGGAGATDGLGGAGAATIVRKPFPVSPGQAIDVTVGKGAPATGCNQGSCPTGADSKFGALIAPGAPSGYRTNTRSVILPSIYPENFSEDSPLVIAGGFGGEASPYNAGQGGSVAGNLGGNYAFGGGGGGASYFGAGGDAANDEPGQHGNGYCSGGGASKLKNGNTYHYGGNGATGIVIVEW